MNKLNYGIGVFIIVAGCYVLYKKHVVSSMQKLKL